MADRLSNDPRVAALNVYGLRTPPDVRSDKGVQFGKFVRTEADKWGRVIKDANIRGEQ